MGDDGDHEAKGGAAIWFLKKFFKTPAAYLGIAVAIGVMKACLGVEMPISGAIGLGILVGFPAGMLTFLAMHGIKSSHQRALAAGKTEESDFDEQTVLESLRDAELVADADLLVKMFADRDAIRKRGESRSGSENADAAHTLELASAIVKESCLQAEELQDLVRRVNDPLLKAPEDGDLSIEKIREDLQRAYQAIADARSRLRRGEKSSKIDFLADSGSLTGLNLSSLASQLEEETAISQGIEERMRPDFDYESRIVMDEGPVVETDGEDSLETES